MTIKYLEPVFKNFGGDYQGSEHFLTKQHEWKAKHTGKFIMSALEDTVRVWAFANAFTHDQVIGQCKAKGRILGGGDIGYSKEQNRVGCSNSSMDFGSLPNVVLIDYFQYFGYSVGTKMNERWVRDNTREWFREHGIKL